MRARRLVHTLSNLLAAGGSGESHAHTERESTGRALGPHRRRLASNTRKSVSAGSRPERKKSCATTVPRGCGALRAYAPSGHPPAACRQVPISYV